MILDPELRRHEEAMELGSATLLAGMIRERKAMRAASGQIAAAEGRTR